MSRHFKDWLSAFCDYASYGEAPRRMYHWVGISTIAGALRRKVWIDQTYFKWFPNFYVILVAPPGIVSNPPLPASAWSYFVKFPASGSARM